MTWWLATISKHQPGNWALCKEVGLFGYTRGMSKCQSGDHILVWFGGRGYIGFGLITDMPRQPLDRTEAPWPGGLYRFTSVIPFRMQVEIPEGGIYLPFSKNLQAVTGFNTAKFQHSLSAVPDDAAQKVSSLLLERDLGDPESDD